MRIDGFLLHLVLFAQKPILGQGVGAIFDRQLGRSRRSRLTSTLTNPP